MSDSRGRRIGTILLLCGLLVLGTAATSAKASTSFPEALRLGQQGSGAGNLFLPHGIAADPTSGHAYVADVENSRVAEFSAWGEFIKAWGWGVRDGSPELQVCTTATGCRAGLQGNGTGQLNHPTGVVLNAGGDVYVADSVAHRVEMFNPAGEFALMFGGEVNKTKSEEVGSTEAERNLCTAASGDVCQAGTVGAGQGQFGDSRLSLAMGPGETIFVGDVGRVEKFDTAGHYSGEVTGVLTGEIIDALAVNGSGIDVALEKKLGEYAEPEESKPGIRQLTMTGELVRTLPASNPQVLAFDASGDLFAVNKHRFEAGSRFHVDEVLEYEPAGACVICEAPTIGTAEENFASSKNDRVLMFGLATNTVTPGGGTEIYTAVYNLGSLSEAKESYVAAYGPLPEKWPPPAVPPRIDAQFATAVNPEDATLRAEINPRFWSDARYYLEYGSSECRSGGCATKVPLPPGSLLTSQSGISKDVATAPVALTGLTPGATYHFRFVAQSGGGGPVYGRLPNGGEATFAEGLEGTFTTPLPPRPGEACPNGAFRPGPGAFLPDCRAYELVTPGTDDVIVQKNIVSNPARLDQAAVGGDAITYSTYRSLEGSKSSPYTSQYIARRTPAGWVGEAISPPQEGPTNAAATKDVQYKAFLPDLSSGWIQYASNLQLDPATPPGFLNLYRREIATGSYQGLIRATPAEPNEFWPELQGVSENGGCAVFVANGRLPSSPSASTTEGINQTYENCKGKLRLISVTTGGTAATVGSSAGTPGGRPYGREASVAHAISADGSRVFWSESSSLNNLGPLFLRLPLQARTLRVSSGPTIFWNATPSGSLALYSESGKLYLYDAEAALAGNTAGERTLLAEGVSGVLGVSEDLSRIYFVSTEAFDGATAGEPNLYLWSGGTIHFIAPLSSADASTSNEIPSPTAPEPLKHVAQVSANGEQAIFMSTGQPTGFDNADQASGQPDAEVYRYDAETETLDCLSCSPSGARPAGRQLNTENPRVYWIASSIPAGESQLYTARALSASGRRVFFDSFDALVPQDTNGRQDVYEWEAPGEGRCSESSWNFYAANGGCLSLISSGESPLDSEFLDSSASGADVFFRTAESLVNWDPGHIDIYDARVEGGLPGPPAEPVPCQGEACQHPASAPEDPTPGSLGYHGPANPPVRRGCPNGRHQVKKHGRKRCVKNAHRKRHRKPKSHRRAAR